MGVLSILMSTGRVGNALVALRCIDVRDKSLSLAFNVVFLSLIGKNLQYVTGSSDKKTIPESTNPKENSQNLLFVLIYSKQDFRLRLKKPNVTVYFL